MIGKVRIFLIFLICYRRQDKNLHYTIWFLFTNYSTLFLVPKNNFVLTLHDSASAEFFFTARFGFCTLSRTGTERGAEHLITMTSTGIYCLFIFCAHKSRSLSNFCKFARSSCVSKVAPHVSNTHFATFVWRIRARSGCCGAGLS